MYFNRCKSRDDHIRYNKRGVYISGNKDKSGAYCNIKGTGYVSRKEMIILNKDIKLDNHKPD